MKTEFNYNGLKFDPGQVIFYNSVKVRLWTVWKRLESGWLHERKIYVSPRATRAAIIDKYEQ